MKRYKDSFDICLVEYFNCIVQSDNETEMPKGKKCNCDNYNKLQVTK